MSAVLLHCMSPLLAQSGHPEMSALCPLSGVERTKSKQDALSAYDPKRTNTGLKSRSAAVSSLACYPLHEPARLNRIQNISGFPQGPAQPFGGTLIVR